MNDLATIFEIRPELMAYIDKGVLVPLDYTEDDARRGTIELLIPSLNVVQKGEVITTYTLTWIGPSHNVGGDPNFEVVIEHDNGDEYIDLETYDDLLAWLEREVGSIGQDRDS